METTKQGLAAYLKISNPSQYKELKAAGKLDEYLDNQMNNTNDRFNDLKMSLLKNDPVPEGATELEAYQHIRDKERIAQELLDEELYH